MVPHALLLLCLTLCCYSASRSTATLPHTLLPLGCLLLLPLCPTLVCQKYSSNSEGRTSSARLGLHHTRHIQPCTHTMHPHPFRCVHMSSPVYRALWPTSTLVTKIISAHTRHPQTLLLAAGLSVPLASVCPPLHGTLELLHCRNMLPFKVRYLDLRRSLR